MIARSWRGFASHENANAYVQHLYDDVVPVLGDIPGYQGIQILRRDTDDGEVEFIVWTTWTSMEAIRQFAGEEPEVAVVAPAARALLARWNERVHHYEVEAPGSGGQ